MKGYGEFEWIKGAGLGFLLICILVFVVGSYGPIKIEVTGNYQIADLQNSLATCNDKLALTCPLCPEVKCIGDMTIPTFIIGCFFGFFSGAMFTLHFGTVLRKKLNEMSATKKVTK